MSALARTTRKSTENRSQRASRPSRVTARLRTPLFSSPIVFRARQLTGVRLEPVILWSFGQTVQGKKLRPPRYVKNQPEFCEARCGVGDGKNQQCRFPAIFELSAGFFRVCKNGLFFVTYCPAPRGCRFSQMWRKRQHEIKLNSARRARARDKSSKKSSIRVRCHIGHREKA